MSFPSGQERDRLRIIALAPNPWDTLWMNRQQLLSRLAKHHAILYSTGPWYSWDRDQEAFRRSSALGRFVTRGSVLVDQPGWLLVRVPRVKLLDRLAIRLAARRWRHGLVSYSNRPLVAYVFHPDLEALASAIVADYVVYHAYDLFRLSDSSPELRESEHRLLEKANLVIASSREIARDLSQRSARHVEFLANGVDFEAFTSAMKGPTPDDIARIPHPRIGYTGNINRKFDFELILALAKRRPEWQFVLVGPTDEIGADDAPKLAKCRDQSNIHLLGERSVTRLPRYTAAFDVGIMCYRVRGLWTQAGYPLKMHEYFACGLPVVSADVPSVREFSHLLRIADGPDEWESALAEALAGDTPGTPQLRRQVASDNSWDRRVATLDDLLIRMARSNRPASH